MKIKIKQGKAIQKEISCRQEQTILEALQEAGVYLPALCAGRGSCGKCKVRLLEGEVRCPDEDNKKMSQRDITDILACKCYPDSDLLLELSMETEEEMTVEVVHSSSLEKADSTGRGNAFIAVDIGTTTIAMALVEEDSGEIRDTFACLNRQRMHGADVISRIAAANGGALGELKKLIEEDLWQGIIKLTNEGKLKIEKVIIAANTTMIHLLMGYSCESLGRHPFSSDHLHLIETTLGDNIKLSQETALRDVALILLPGISAFVGGDIVSDLLICPGFWEEGIALLLDMGTNGEMVIGNKHRLLAASTAAGPAFEGGNITCGTGSIPGAINQIRILNRRAAIGTIGGKQPPVGICGTGIIEAIAELKKNRLMNKEGLLQPPYGNMGYPLWAGGDREKIAIYQQDIRQIQLAKGAIRAGMEQLMEAFGCKPQEVDKVYLAGGFGTQLPVNGAIDIGLFPEEFKGKIVAIGNGALQGAIAYGTMFEPEGIKRQETSLSILKEKEKQLMEIKDRVEGLNLALAEGFEERYLKYLDF